MKTENRIYKPFFKTKELTQADIIDIIDHFAIRLNRLKIKIDAIYPGDSIVFPFAMYLSGKTGIPIKTEKFLKPENRILILFSIFPEQRQKDGTTFLTEHFIKKKVEIFRKQFPNSPSVLIASNKHTTAADIQLLLFEKTARTNSYRFLSEAYKNFYFPTEGEFLHIDETFWQSSEKELTEFLKAKRIRDAAFSFGYEEDRKTPTPIEEDIDILIWEKLEKLHLNTNFYSREQRNPSFKIKYKKLIDIKEKRDNSVVVSLLETIAQSLEQFFPVRLAYSNYEIVSDNKVLIVPVAKEIVNGIELKLEIIHKTASSTEQEKLIKNLKDSLKSIVKDILKKKTFRPYMEIIIDDEEESIRIYITWFLERGTLNTLEKKLNKKWLLSRLILRKQTVIRKNTLLKELKNFSFSPESTSTIFSIMESIWGENPLFFKSTGNKIKDILQEKNLWYLIGVYALKIYDTTKIDGVAGNKALLRFLLSLQGKENHHHFFAETDTYVFPVQTERKYRPNWERLIKTEGKIILTREVLNPKTPVAFTIKDENGFSLGTVPKSISHYLAAKEEAGYTLKVTKLHINEIMFSNSSYWVKVKCLK